MPALFGKLRLSSSSSLLLDLQLTLLQLAKLTSLCCFFCIYFLVTLFVYHLEFLLKNASFLTVSLSGAHPWHICCISASFCNYLAASHSGTTHSLPLSSLSFSLSLSGCYALSCLSLWPALKASISKFDQHLKGNVSASEAGRGSERARQDDIGFKALQQQVAALLLLLLPLLMLFVVVVVALMTLDPKSSNARVAATTKTTTATSAAFPASIFTKKKKTQQREEKRQL